METRITNRRRARARCAAALVAAASAGAPFAATAQDDIGATALTIYSTTQPGAVPPELYRPVAGEGNYFTGQAVPGYAMIRQERGVQLERGANRLNFRNVAAYIDPTTVTFESLTSPDGTRVIEQSFQFDLVSGEKLMERYIDQVITIDQLVGNSVKPITGRLLSTQGGLVLGSDNGEIHAIRSYENIHFPTLPGGLMTRPTLVWDVTANNAGRENTRITYQTAGITWWADYNLVWSEGADANNGLPRRRRVGQHPESLGRNLRGREAQAHCRRRESRATGPEPAAAARSLGYGRHRRKDSGSKASSSFISTRSTATRRWPTARRCSSSCFRRCGECPRRSCSSTPARNRVSSWRLPRPTATSGCR